ncbi:flagellar protein FlgN [Evansella cellulosilytica]|uniref:FlgN family protein n=1 Tax=Evansella cellulosilytica (strain ATCC 21833 / DSM 2522 / FERM P-1141 / JCM 9156 / N-4) TaxID=649639 RepID=E6TS98_EVAC2|nr:flagellar protein FlgN [Evansella cellulosilytica]ADU31867.1 FlgN family protein [Evansella cellulosilytica DSM 2522]
MDQVQSIIRIFQGLVLIHEKLNEQALAKQTVVTKGEIPALEKLMKEETVLVKQLQKLEITRRNVVEQWLQEKGLVKENVTMHELIDLFPAEHKKELHELEEKLVAEIEKLKQQNELNQQLIEESLRFVNMSLGAMYPQKEFGNYRRPDQRSEHDDDFEAGGPSIFDSKA